MKENTKISLLLSEGRLYSALQLLKPLALKTSDFRLTDQLQSLEQNYHFLIDYFVSGAEDPERENILKQIIRQTFLLYDEIRKVNTDTPQPLLQMRAKAADFQPADDKYSHLKQVFYTTWLDTLKNDNLLATDEEKNMYVAGLMLNIIEYFSEEKVLQLCHLARKYTGETGQRAKVAMLIVLHHYKYRIQFFPKICSVLDSMRADEQLRENLKQIVIQLLNTALTPAITEEMESLSKDFQQRADKENKNIIIALDEIDESNPEWGESVRSLLDKHLENVGRLHGEGADVNYSSTKGLLGNSFFTRDIANWFIPFGFDNTETGIDFTTENAQLLKGILLSNTESCDIDKYAICTIFNQLQHQLKDTKLPSVIEDMKQFGDIENLSENYSEDSMSLYFVRTLYRFFFHNKWIIPNLMSSITEIGSEYACRLLLSKEDIGAVADRCLSLNLYKEAIQTIGDSSDQLSLQKKGYALQKTGNYTEAISTYDKALLYAEDSWTMTHKAYCQQKSGQYEKALLTYNRLLDSDKDNRKLLLNKAQCLVSLLKYEEALEVFYHLDLLYPGNTNIERGLAWCAFASATTDNSRYVLAEQYLEKIAYEDGAQMNDYINYGHLLLVTGHRNEAIRFYRQAASNKDSHAAFLQQMEADKSLLIEKGIKEEEMVLIIESVEITK